MEDHSQPMEVDPPEDSLNKHSSDAVTKDRATNGTTKIDEVDNGEESSSSMCSSSFTLSDEEDEEEKKAFKDEKQDLIEKYGLDKLSKHFPEKLKLTPRVKYYTFDIKRKQREELPLRGWHKLRLYKDDKFLNDWINEPDSVSTMNVDRINASDISVEEFMEKYEKPAVPVILLGCADHWDALSKWNFPDLIKKFKK